MHGHVNVTLSNTMIKFYDVCVSVIIAVLVPELGPFISLIGAVCLSMLGLIFPSIIELITYQVEPGRTSWFVILKNILIIAFGILGFITGAYTSIDEIIQQHFPHMNPLSGLNATLSNSTTTQ